MYGLVKSELMKMRHTFSMKLVFFAPLATLLLGYILSGSYVQLSAYNWWYTIVRQHDCAGAKHGYAEYPLLAGILL